jgi:hypothetical protein
MRKRHQKNWVLSFIFVSRTNLLSIINLLSWVFCSIFEVRWNIYDTRLVSNRRPLLKSRPLTLCLLQYRYLTSMVRQSRFYPYWKNCRYNYFWWQNFDRVNGHTDMRVWKGRWFENILKLDRGLFYSACKRTKGQKDKRKNNDLQNTTQKTTDWAIRTPLLFGVNSGVTKGKQYPLH